MTFIRPFPGSTGMTVSEVCARCGEVSWLNRWVSSPVGAASVREMPVESRSCGELSLHSRPAWVESPQGVPRPRGRPRAQSTARLRQELEGHWARGRGGTASRTPRGTGQVCPVHHRKASPVLPRCPAEKFPLPCLASSPKGPPPHLLYSAVRGRDAPPLPPGPGGSQTAGDGAEAAAGFIFPSDPV